MKLNLKDFAGLWVALTEQETVGGVGRTISDAVHASRVAWPKERLRIVLVSEHPPHVPLPAWPLKSLRALASHRTLWLVGGAVRDLLLGRDPDDWDFVVLGSALQFARKVADSMQGDFYVLDAERGTGRAIVTSPYRTRPVYLDFAEVRGTSIDEDLYARDFTINAIAMTVDGRIIDPTGGIKDLREHRLSMVRRDALASDPIRLLRALRFSYQFGLLLGDETASAVQQLAPEIRSAAGERIQAELTKLLKVPEPDRALAALKRYGLLPYLFPEIDNLAANQWEHTLALIRALIWLDGVIQDRSRLINQTRVENAPDIPSWVYEDLRHSIGDLLSHFVNYLDKEINSGLSRKHLLNWAALLHAVGSPVSAAGSRHARPKENPQILLITVRCKALRLPNDATDVITSVVSHQYSPEALVDFASSRRSVYRYFQETNEYGLAITWFSLAHYLAISDMNPDRARWQRMLKATRTLFAAYFQHHTEIIDPVPLLGGRDLMQMGLKPGPRLGAALRWLIESQAAGEIRTRDQAVDEISRRYLASPSSSPAADGDA